jgi:hypothetical protein
VTTYLIDSPIQTVDDIVNSTVISTRLPISQVTFTPQNLIDFMNDEQRLSLTKLIKSIREDYWLTNFDQQILPNIFSYVMPPRAPGGALRNIVFVDPSGFEIDCPHLDPDQIKTPSYFAFRPAWQGQGAFLQDDQVVLWPQTFSNVSYKLRQKYERRPNALTSTLNCGQITAVNIGPQTLVFASLTPFKIGQRLDIIGVTGQHTSQGDDLLISNVVGTTITIDPSTPFTAKVVVGSWACPAGLTCVPQMPDEAYALLLGRVMLRVAIGLQNANLSGVATKMCEESKELLTQILTPRVSGSPKKFVNKNVVGGPYNFPYYR